MSSRENKSSSSGNKTAPDGNNSSAPKENESVPTKNKSAPSGSHVNGMRTISSKKDKNPKEKTQTAEEITSAQVEGCIDLVEKTVFEYRRLQSDENQQSAHDNFEMHPLLNDGIVALICKKDANGRVSEKRRFIWVSHGEFHWVNSPKKPSPTAWQGKTIGFSDISRIKGSNTKDGTSPFVFTILTVANELLVFKIPTPKGRTTDQAIKIASFWSQSLQKMVNSTNLMGHLINSTEMLVWLSQPCQQFKSKLQTHGILVVCKLVKEKHFKWFYRMFLEDEVLYFVKECLVKNVKAASDVNLLYESEQQDNIVFDESSTELQDREKRQQLSKENVGKHISSKGQQSYLQYRRKKTEGMGNTTMIEEREDQEYDNDSVFTQSSIEETIGKEPAFNIQIKQLYFPTSEEPLHFSLTSASNSFRQCPILPKSKSKLREVSITLVHNQSAQSCNIIIPSHKSSTTQDGASEASKNATMLQSIIAQQIQKNVPKSWLQQRIPDDARYEGPQKTDSSDSNNRAQARSSIMEAIEFRVNARRLQTMFELTGHAIELCPKIKLLLIRNRGNEEALFAALSERYGCTVAPYRHADDALLAAYQHVMGSTKPDKRIAGL